MPFANSHGSDAVPSPVRPNVLVNIGLGGVFALGVAFTAFMLVRSWGGTYWIPPTAVTLVVCALALLRERHRLGTAIAGMIVTAVAVVVSLVADLPQEPSPATALALAVLVGSAIRTLPARPTVAVTAGGAAVVAATWFAGPTAVTSMATMLVVGGLVAGVLLRVFSPVRRSGAATAGPSRSRSRQ